MPLPTDPILAQQWHLINTNSGEFDLNVAGVWNPTSGPAYTGQGITVVVIDDGFDYTHPDLAPNYDTSLDYDFDGTNDFDPFGLSTDSHGTAVTGIIGADNNGTGAVGVAFNSTLIGYRVEGLITDAWLGSIAEAITAAATNALADVVNISQGIANDLYSEFGAGYDAYRFDNIETAIGTAVETGRSGLGTIIVKSAGNSRGDYIGASNDYDVNADDWTNDTRQIVVAAVDADGDISDYSSYGAAVLVSAFGGPGTVVTTDRVGAAGYDAGNFTYSFNGTSSAAPMVSGIAALMLDANESLGWRDVQSILANSARHVGSSVGGGTSGFEFFSWGWNGANTWNGGGMHFSNDYGYGLVDALAAVRLAETWLLGGQTSQKSANEYSQAIHLVNSTVIIPDGNLTGTTFTESMLFSDVVERVTVTVTFSTSYIADMSIFLISPDGTESILLQKAGGGADFNGSWTFESQAFRGEHAGGDWSVRIVDNYGGDTISVSDIIVTAYGSASNNDRYVFTNEYSDYVGVGGHTNAIVDTNGGSADTANVSAVSTGSTIRLDGVAGQIDGVMTSFSNVENAIGGDGADSIVGSAGANMLYGMRGNDTLSGGAGADSIYGGVGNDVLSGNAGADRMEGGLGNDTYWVHDTTDVVIEAAGAGTDIINTALASYSLAAIANVENLNGVSSSAQELRGNTLANAIYGGVSNDTLAGGLGNDTLYGGNGNDTYWVHDTTDKVVEAPSGGTDTVYTALVSYSLAAVANVEKLVGVNASGQELRGNTLANTINGSTGNDTLAGGLGNDTLYGGNGNDVLSGNEGADSMVGGNGNDTYWVQDTTDLIYEAAGGGNDGVNTAIASFSIGAYANVENLTGVSAAGQILGGNTLANVLSGNSGNDQLYGGSGADTLKGNAGSDYLFGGTGIDVLTGGTGADTFVFNTTLGASNVDTITDFSVVDDRVYLENAIFTSLAATGVLAASAFGLGAGATTAAQRIIYNAATGQLSYDADGNGGGAQVAFATLAAGLAMTNADFFVI